MGSSYSTVLSMFSGKFDRITILMQLTRSRCQKKGGIKKEVVLWDYLTFNTGVKQKNFTDEPHLTVGMTDKFIEATFTIPYRIKGKTKKNFYSLRYSQKSLTAPRVVYNYGD